MHKFRLKNRSAERQQMHWSEATPFFLSKALPQWPYLRRPYLRWPYLRGLGRVFSSRSLLGLPRPTNKCVTNQFRTALTRRLKKLSLSLVTLIINPTKREWLRCTRLLFLRCILSLRRLLPVSPGEHQAYKTYYLYFKKPPRSYQSPHQVELIQGSRLLLKNPSPNLSIFLPYFLLGLGGFLLIDLLWRPIPSGAARALSTVTLFWEVGFPPQFPTGLGGFSSTRLPPSHALRVEFSKLPNRSHPT